MISDQNIPQLTKSFDGRRIVDWCDWKTFLDDFFKHIPAITTYHHFRFTKSSPGTVFLRKFVDSPEEAFVMTNMITLPNDQAPQKLTPKGMDLKRQWYLFEEITQFCSTPEAAQLTCPHPKDQKPSSNQTQVSTANQTSDKVANNAKGTKRKRACSHCHKEGHTKTKWGMITCPELL